MHLGVVATRLTEAGDHLTDRVLGMIRPLQHMDQYLLPVLSAIEVAIRDQDIIVQLTAVGDEEVVAVADRHHADEISHHPLQYLDHLTLDLLTGAKREQLYHHLIAIEGVGRVSLCHTDRVAPILGVEEIVSLARLPPERSGQLGILGSVDVLVTGGACLDELLAHQLINHLADHLLLRAILCADRLADHHDRHTDIGMTGKVVDDIPPEARESPLSLTRLVGRVPKCLTALIFSRLKFLSH